MSVWRHGLMLGSRLLDQEVRVPSPGLTGPRESLFVQRLSSQSDVQRVLNYTRRFVVKQPYCRIAYVKDSSQLGAENLYGSTLHLGQVDHYRGRCIFLHSSRFSVADSPLLWTLRTHLDADLPIIQIKSVLY
ncbi:hypothetical protein ElyMa_005653000 [Elysia marginata]|uniref:Uncharacterized protein n=1 Tax=Elysia marginata TaxID=1093978 RepID=A0AAV4FAX4_9GAST|nr:hypothetical protein ElyMa_005653000 [Elysia marginata]